MLKSMIAQSLFLTAYLGVRGEDWRGGGGGGGMGNGGGKDGEGGGRDTQIPYFSDANDATLPNFRHI